MKRENLKGQKFRKNYLPNSALSVAAAAFDSILVPC